MHGCVPFILSLSYRLCSLNHCLLDIFFCYFLMNNSIISSLVTRSCIKKKNEHKTNAVIGRTANVYPQQTEVYLSAYFLLYYIIT